MTSKRKLKSLSILKRKSVRVALIIVGVVLVLFLGWFAVRNNTLYAPNKDNIRRQVQAGLNVANFQGVNVYNSLQDAGCASNGVGVAGYWYCGFVGQRYFKGTGDLAAYLRDADKTLIAAGWQHSPADESAGVYGKAFSGQSSYSLTYLKDGYRLELISYNGRDGNYSIQKLFDNGKIPSLKTGEFVYGVWSYTRYWSCSQDSFFKLPCPTPPSKPNL